jgi:hypothetical protein
MDYVRLQEVQGLLGKNFTNSITPQLFNRNQYIAAWNLTTSPNPNMLNMLPCCPNTTTMKVVVNFSEAIPCDLTMLVWQQFSSALSIDKHRNAQTGYYNLNNP